MNRPKKRSTQFKLSQPCNYTNIDLLAQYITEQGKILPKRITNLSNKEQRKITKNIKRARILSLIPFINK